MLAQQENQNENITTIAMEKPRKYQLELLKEAVDGNTICILPTGTGKTLLACLLMDQMLHCNHEKKEYLGDDYFLSSNCCCERNANQEKQKFTRKIFFLVPTTALRKQQQETIFKYFYRKGCSKLKMKKDFTIDSSKTWNCMVATPQALLNALSSGIVNISDAILLIFDEAHHATKDHQYFKIMQDYYRSNKPIDSTILANNFTFLKDRTEIVELPKILGLTATPSSQSLYKNSLNEHTLFLRKANLETNLDSCIKVPFDFIEEMNNNTNKPRQHSLGYPYGQNKDQVGCLIDFCHNHNFRDISESDIETHHASLGLLASLYIISSICDLDVFDLFKEFFPSFNMDQPLQFSTLSEVLESPFLSEKVKYLFDLIDTYQTINPNMRCIIFVERISHVKALTKLLRSYVKFEHLNCQELAGSSVMSKQAQAAVVKEFSSKTKLLVCTKAGQEGLSISKCSLVIQFDICNTTTEHTQSKGRARHELSRYIVFYERENYSHQIMITNMGSNDKNVLLDSTIEDLKQELKSEVIEFKEDIIEEDVESLLQQLNELDEEECIKDIPLYVPKPIQYTEPIYDENGNTQLFISQIIINFNGKEEFVALLTMGEVFYPMNLVMYPNSLKLFPKGFLNVTNEEMDLLKQYYLRLCKLIYCNQALNSYYTGDGRFYLIAPYENGGSPRESVNWDLLKNLSEELNADNNDYPKSASMLDTIKSGDILPIDRLIITIYNKVLYAPCYIDYHQTPLSIFERRGIKTSYKDYLEYKGVKITDENQPMLNAYSISHNREVMLMPEFCKPVNLRVDLIESLRCAFKTSNEGTLMSLMEQSLVAHDLKRKLFPNSNIDLTELRKAITHRTSQNLDTNYERYEFFGDSILKFAVTLDLVLRFPYENMKFYNEEKVNKISNSNLRKLAQETSLMDYFIETQFYHHNVAGLSFTKSEQEATIKGKKVRADIVESLIGLAGSRKIQEGVDLIKQLGLIKKNIFVVNRFILSSNPDAVKRSIEQRLPSIVQYAQNLQQIIGYKFNNILYAYYALIHSSIDIGLNVNYETLEFIGDAVLDLCISRIMFLNFNLDQSEMHTFRSDFVRNTVLERIAKEFHIDSLLFVKRDLKLKAKTISDIVEAILGAVALDSTIDLNVIDDLLYGGIFGKKLREWLDEITDYEKNKIAKTTKDVQTDNLVNIKVRLRRYNNRDVFKLYLPIISISNFTDLVKVVTDKTNKESMRYYYLDNENEWITFDSQEEWNFLLSQHDVKSTLHLSIY